MILIINKNQPFGILIALVVWIIGKNHFIKTIKSLKRQFNKKPAIELTEEYLFDYTNNIKIYWKNIKQINLWQVRGNTYVCFDLKDVESYIKQTKSLTDKFLFKIKLYEKNIFVKTEISLVKGKNQEIFNEINKNHQRNKLQ